MGSPHFSDATYRRFGPATSRADYPHNVPPTCIPGERNCGKAASLGWKHFRTLPNSFGPVLLPRRLHKYYNRPGSPLLGLNQMKQAGTSHQGDTHS